MLTTTRLDANPTLTFDGDEAVQTDNELVECYQDVISDRRLSWTAHHHWKRCLGSGGQGVVYLSERRGAEGFTLPVAVKVFSPEVFPDARAYDEEMLRMGGVAATVAQIQQDNLAGVQNFVDRQRIRMMVMEWIDGYDLQRLMVPSMLVKIKARVSSRRWARINNILVTAGPEQPRLKPGVAVAVVRDGLAALAALHREGIVHSDIKPSNIMLKQTGPAKIIDIGSAFPYEAPPSNRTCTPAYAAPEVLEGQASMPQSDLASLGYVLIELLAGRKPFAGLKYRTELLEAKRVLPHRLTELLPTEVTVNELLMNFCRRLIAPDPNCRFPSAEAAELVDEEGAAAFHKQLVKGDLSSEYDNEIRIWLEELKELEEGAADDE